MGKYSRLSPSPRPHPRSADATSCGLRVTAQRDVHVTSQRPRAAHLCTTSATACVMSGLATCSRFHSDHTNSLSACKTQTTDFDRLGCSSQKIHCRQWSLAAQQHARTHTPGFVQNCVCWKRKLDTHTHTQSDLLCFVDGNQLTLNTHTHTHTHAHRSLHTTHHQLTPLICPAGVPNATRPQTKSSRPVKTAILSRKR